MSVCEHHDFIVKAAVNRLTDGDGGPVKWFSADITISYQRCGLPFVFLGLPVGSLPRGAATNVDATELRIALAPQGSVPTMKDECEQIGFRIRGGVPS